MAVRILSYSIDIESETEPPLIYERDPSQRNAMHRPYRIYHSGITYKELIYPVFGHAYPLLHLFG